jgi:hypothetical protein
MEASGQFHAPAALPPEKSPGWATEPVWTQWREDTNLAPAWNRNPALQPAPVAIQTPRSKSIAQLLSRTSVIINIHTHSLTTTFTRKQFWLTDRLNKQFCFRRTWPVGLRSDPLRDASSATTLMQTWRFDFDRPVGYDPALSTCSVTTAFRGLWFDEYPR